MVRPLFYSDSSFVDGQLVELEGDEGRHAATVRRMRTGEPISLTNGTTLYCHGVVETVDAKSLTVRVNEVQAIAQPKLRFELIQALAKGDRDEMAIQAATELGIDNVTPWQSARSIVKWDQTKAAKSIDRWQSICDEAAKQSLRPNFVSVGELVTTSSLVRSISLYAKLLVLDPTAADSLVDLELPDEGIVGLVVGPEGGIADDELTALEQAGAIRVRLGSGILRTSTAGSAALAVLSASSGRWQ